MKNDYSIYYAIGATGGLIGLIYFFDKKNLLIKPPIDKIDTTKYYRGQPLTDKQIIDNLDAIKKLYGTVIAQKVEKIFRNETAHFTSQQFLNTYSPGQEKFADSFPYGWESMKATWLKYPKLAPIGFFTMPENKTGIKKTFIKYPTLFASMLALSEYLKIYPASRWYSTDPIKQKSYQSVLDSIVPRFVNNLT